MIPPEESTSAAAQAPTQAEAQVRAQHNRNDPTPSKLGPGPRTISTGGWERTDGPGHPPGRPRPLRPSAPPPPSPPALRAARVQAPAPVKETAEATDARAAGVSH